MIQRLFIAVCAIAGLGYATVANEVQSPSESTYSDVLSKALDWHHVGCFADSPGLRTLPQVYEKYRPLMNIATCTTMCLARGKPVAALKSSLEMYFGQQCFCMEENLKPITPAEKCDVPCDGDKGQMCGGTEDLSVYIFRGVSKPRFNKEKIATSTGTIYKYEGCWQDIAPFHVLTGAQSRNASTKSIEQCTEFCGVKNFSIAGLSYYGACYCADVLSGSQPADPQDCNLPCVNDESEICGGANVLSIYATATPALEPYPTSPPAKKLKYKGHDISSLLMLEQGLKIGYQPYGWTWNQADVDHPKKTFEQLLQDTGSNAVRLRLFTSPDPYNFDGTTNGLAYNIALAKRAVAANQSVMLSVHYSDRFADPGEQFIPSLWRGFSEPDLLSAVASYTTKVLDRFHAEGIPIEFYATGNEIRLGMLWPYGGNKTYANFDSLVKIQNAIIDGVHASKMAVYDETTNSGLKIMLHVDGGAQIEKMKFFWKGMLSRGLSREKFHAIGLTWYPFYSILETQPGALASFTWMAKTLKLPLIVVETNWPQKCSNTKDVRWPEDLRVDGSPAAIPFSPRGQAIWFNMVAHVLAKVPDGLGQGLYNWESGWSNMTALVGTSCEDNTLISQYMYRENKLSETGFTPECVMSEAAASLGRL